MFPFMIMRMRLFPLINCGGKALFPDPQQYWCQMSAVFFGCGQAVGLKGKNTVLQCFCGSVADHAVRPERLQAMRPWRLDGKSVDRAPPKGRVWSRPIQYGRKMLWEPGSGRGVHSIPDPLLG